MCQTNNWRRLEATKIVGDLTRFELRGMRSDNILIIEPIEIGANFGGTIDKLIEQINNFESFRNCKCSSSHVCLEHSIRGDNNS